MRALVITLLLSPLATTVLVQSARAQDKRPEAVAAWTDVPPTIDGKLDEQAWLAAPLQSGFVERSPTLRATPKSQTTFRVLLDAEAMYFGIFCRDTEPEGIRSLTLARDSGDIFRDDALSIKLDVALDKRTTLGFVVNPAGTRFDYRGIDERDFRSEFDAVWQGAGARSDDGWSAELRIPYSVLGIDTSDPPPAIGLNLSRDHARRNATYDWALLPPPYSPIAASRYGTLRGFEILKSRTNDGGGIRSLEVIPYALTGFSRSEQDDSNNLKDERLLNAGVDVKANYGPVTQHLTVNTDFAQVDLDNQVVNLSRFGLFLPEKRDFFLEDSEIFDFGRPQQAQMLYSRRIGLNEDGAVPILVGNKFVGRPTRSTRFALLQVTTRPEGATPWTSNIVGRGIYELGDGSNAGVMITNRQSYDEIDDRNFVAGADIAFRGKDVPIVLRTFGMGSITGDKAPEPATATGGSDAPQSDGPAPGAGASAELNNELVRPSLAYAYYDPELRTDLGFLQRVGVHRGDYRVTVRPRVDAGGVSVVEIGSQGKAFSNPDFDELLDWDAELFAEVEFDAGYYVGVFGKHIFETVLEPFDIGRETTIPAAEYHAWSGGIYYGTPGTYAISINGHFVLREFFGGGLFQALANTSWAPTSLVRFDVSTQYDRVFFEDLPSFDSLTVNGRINFGFTRAFGLRLFTGYNLLQDLVLLQSRLRWTYARGSDLFLVQQVNLDDDTALPTDLSVIVKTSFRFSLL